MGGPQKMASDKVNTHSRAIGPLAIVSRACAFESPPCLCGAYVGGRADFQRRMIKHQ